MSNLKQQLKKGLLEIGILSLLDEKDYYGYELIHELKEYSNDVFALKEGTLYPILYRLEDNKVIESYWETDETSRSKPRKYYQITDSGRDLYKESKQAFEEITSGLKNIINRKY